MRASLTKLVRALVARKGANDASFFIARGNDGACGTIARRDANTHFAAPATGLAEIEAVGIIDHTFTATEACQRTRDLNRRLGLFTPFELKRIIVQTGTQALGDQVTYRNGGGMAVLETGADS